jgi:enoyl-CoA hydratase
LDLALALAAADLGLDHRGVLGELCQPKLKRCHLIAQPAFSQLHHLNQLLQLLVAQCGELLGWGERYFRGLGRCLAVGHGASLHKTAAPGRSNGGGDTADLVRFERRGKVAWVTIDHPPANALSQGVLDGLRSAFALVEADSSLGAVVLTGAGERFFVAGADIGEFVSQGADGTRAKIADGQQLTLEMERQRFPIVAAINGFALGGGLELAMACDIRIASSTAKMGQPEVLLGIVPGWGGTQRLPRLVGRGRALELLLSGEQVAATRALELGLVNRVVEPDQLEEAAGAIADELARAAPLAVAAIKRAVNRGLSLPLDAGLAAELEEFDSTFRTADALEGISAFLQKRQAEWTGR